MIPLPCLRVDRLTHTPQQPQGLAAMLPDMMIAFLHKGPYGSRGGVQVCDVVLVHDLP